MGRRRFWKNQWEFIRVLFIEKLGWLEGTIKPLLRHQDLRSQKVLSSKFMLLISLETILNILKNKEGKETELFNFYQEIKNIL